MPKDLQKEYPRAYPGWEDSFPVLACAPLRSPDSARWGHPGSHILSPQGSSPSIPGLTAHYLILGMKAHAKLALAQPSGTNSVSPGRIFTYIRGKSQNPLDLPGQLATS